MATLRECCIRAVGHKIVIDGKDGSFGTTRGACCSSANIILITLINAQWAFITNFFQKKRSWTFKSLELVLFEKAIQYYALLFILCLGFCAGPEKFRHLKLWKVLWPIKARGSAKPRVVLLKLVFKIVVSHPQLKQSIPLPPSGWHHYTYDCKSVIIIVNNFNNFNNNNVIIIIPLLSLTACNQKLNLLPKMKHKTLLCVSTFGRDLMRIITLDVCRDLSQFTQSYGELAYSWDSQLVAYGLWYLWYI